MKSILWVFTTFGALYASAQPGNFGIGTPQPGSKLTVNGSIGLPYHSVTATSYSMAAADYYVVWNGSATGAITLPAAISGTGNYKGRLYAIKNTSPSFALGVAANGDELIDQSGGTGTSSISLASGQSLTLISTGAASGITWEVVSLGSALPAASSWAVSGNDQYSALPGNVGIGTASPSSKLTVSGDIEIPAASNYKYSTPKEKIYSIPGVAFNAEGPYKRSIANGGVYVEDFMAPPFTPVNLYAGVNLPDGAIITKLDAYVDDGEGNGNFTGVELYRNDAGAGLSNPNTALMAATGGTYVGFEGRQKLTTSIITLPTIDNTNYHYYLKVGTFVSYHLRLYRVAISYK